MSLDWLPRSPCCRRAVTWREILIHGVIVIGVDGMDPLFLERHWDSLPNLRSLRDTGGFRRLKTTTPPQSPVAWSTFITGFEPQANHGIFDFVHRNPQTLSPYSSMNRTDPPRFQLSVGEWLIPLSSGRVVSLRNGLPFWKLLVDRGVPVTTMRVPTNYPPAKAGRALAGMGVPDLRGTFGIFTLYTDEPEEIPREVSGGHIQRVDVCSRTDAWRFRWRDLKTLFARISGQ